MSSAERQKCRPPTLRLMNSGGSSFIIFLIFRAALIRRKGPTAKEERVTGEFGWMVFALCVKIFVLFAETITSDAILSPENTKLRKCTYHV